MSSPRVSIVILNWNGWRDTVECLESLFQIDYEDYDIVVLDNGSRNDSVHKIEEFCEGKLKVESGFLEYNPNGKPIDLVRLNVSEAEKESRSRNIGCAPGTGSSSRLVLITSDTNLGFAEGCNVAMTYSLRVLGPDHVLLLNNDTVVDRAFLGYLVNVLESESDIGFVGPKNYFYDYSNSREVINFAGGTIDMRTGVSSRFGFAEMDKGQHDMIKECDYLPGACVMIKREVLEKIGLFDPVYFAYWEDMDLCIRGLKAGYKLLYVPESRIWHKISKSSHGGQSAFYFARNRFRFMKKLASRKDFSTFVLYFFLYQFWVNWVSYLLMYRDWRGFANYVKGTLAGIIMVLSPSSMRY